MCVSVTCARRACQGFTFEPILCYLPTLLLSLFLPASFVDTRRLRQWHCLQRIRYALASQWGARVYPLLAFSPVEFACSTILFCSLLYRLCVWTGCPPARLLFLSRAIYQCRSFVAPPPLLSRIPRLVSPASQRPVLAHAHTRQTHARDSFLRLKK
jgi:hypothetical protein